MNDFDRVTCPPNAAHGHPDQSVAVSVKWLRFLDAIYSACQPQAQRGTAAQQAARAAWVLAGDSSITLDEVPADAAHGCWEEPAVTALREMLWSGHEQG